MKYLFKLPVREGRPPAGYRTGWRWALAVEWKPQDLWIGAFWERTASPQRRKHRRGRKFSHIDVWVCIIPCVPLHLFVQRPILEYR